MIFFPYILLNFLDLHNAYAKGGSHIIQDLTLYLIKSIYILLYCNLL